MLQSAVGALERPKNAVLFINGIAFDKVKSISKK
jgi:hypothetical protein